jgi:rhodanese-related sulfurtransferase
MSGSKGLIPSLVGILLVSGFFGAANVLVRPSVREAFFQERRTLGWLAANELGSSALWVDARPMKEFLAGHQPGAVLLNESAWDSLFPGFLEAWNEEMTVVVYCNPGGCDSARRVCDRLRSEVPGIKAVVLEGGWPRK